MVYMDDKKALWCTSERYTQYTMHTYRLIAVKPPESISEHFFGKNILEEGGEACPQTLQ